jgi:hypothetical protein
MVFPISEVNPDILKSAFRRLSVIHSSLKTRIIPKNDVPADSWIYGCEVNVIKLRTEREGNRSMQKVI